jgi:DNA-binding CsgD family transcriptional regulator
MEERDGGRPRRRLNAYGRMARRERIFARMREGFAYDEIAAEEGVTAERIRQIVSETLQKRGVDPAADHAKLQLARLERVMSVAAEALAQGDLKAGPLYLKTIDRLDRYQKSAAVVVRDEEEIRERLLAKLNAAAERLGYDKVLAYNKRVIAEFEAKRRAMAEANAGFPPSDEEVLGALSGPGSESKFFSLESLVTP